MNRVLAVIFALSMAPVALAGEMSDNTSLDASQVKVDEAAKDVSARCEGTLTGKIDRKGFMGNEKALDYAGGYCSTAVSGVSGVCEKMPTHKKDIMKAVKSVTCHFDAAITDHHAVKIEKKGTNVDVTINTNSANISEQVRDYLTKAL